MFSWPLELRSEALSRTVLQSAGSEAAVETCWTMLFLLMSVT